MSESKQDVNNNQQTEGQQQRGNQKEEKRQEDNGVQKQNEKQLQEENEKLKENLKKQEEEFEKRMNAAIEAMANLFLSLFEKTAEKEQSKEQGKSSQQNVQQQSERKSLAEFIKEAFEKYQEQERGSSQNKGQNKEKSQERGLNNNQPAPVANQSQNTSNQKSINQPKEVTYYKGDGKATYDQTQNKVFLNKGKNYEMETKQTKTIDINKLNKWKESGKVDQDQYDKMKQAMGDKNSLDITKSSKISQKESAIGKDIKSKTSEYSFGTDKLFTKESKKEIGGTSRFDDNKTNKTIVTKKDGIEISKKSQYDIQKQNGVKTYSKDQNGQNKVVKQENAKATHSVSKTNADNMKVDKKFFSSNKLTIGQAGANKNAGAPTTSSSKSTNMGK